MWYIIIFLMGILIGYRIAKYIYIYILTKGILEGTMFAKQNGKWEPYEPWLHKPEEKK
jgi:hypothetical protein